MQNSTTNTNSPIETKPPKGFWGRIARFFGFGKTEDVPKPEEVTPKEEPQKTKQEEPTIEQLTEEINKRGATIGKIVSITSNDPEEAKRQALEHLNNTATAFSLWGLFDGQTFHRSIAIEGIAKTTVQNLGNYYERTFKGITDSTEVDYKTKENLAHFAEKDYERHKDYEHSLDEKRKWDYKSFSWGLGVFYIILSLALIGADIALSLPLSQDVFALPQPWENVILALGIAFCAVYVKIMYDEYIGFPIDKSIGQFKQSKSTKTKRFGEKKVLSQEERQAYQKSKEDKETAYHRKYQKAWWIRFWVKFTILVISLTTLVALGQARYNFFVSNKKASIMQAMQNEGTVDIKGGNINDKEQVEKLKAAQDITNMRMSAYEAYSTWLVFMLINILFPLIGGVCMSLGLDKMQNYWELEKTRSNFEAVKKAYTIAQEEVAKAKQKYVYAKQYYEWCADKEKFEKDYIERFLQHYIKGYEEGAMISETELYDIAERMRRTEFIKKAIHETNP